MSALSSLGSLGSLLGGVSGATQAGPSQASRGTDYNPVTNINAVGAPDYAGLGSLINSINAGNSYNGGANTSQILANTFMADSGTSWNPLLIIAAVGIVGILLWRKFGK